MSIKKKKTNLLVAEIKVIAFSVKNRYCRNVLLEAAERLEDTDKIATFFRNKIIEIMEGENEETE